MPKSLPNAIAEVERLLERGDLLLAFDRAGGHLRRYRDSEVLKHRGVLALARAGATDRAARLFREWGLDRSAEGHVLALEARIAKDRALKLSGEARRAALGEAAAIYRRIYEAKPDYYPAINWASLAFLAGDRDQARRVAEIVLADPKVADAADYWALATRAEANLLLARRDRAAADISQAAKLADAGAGARSSTRRQFRLILAEAGLGDPEIATLLAPLAAPLTLHVIAAPGTGFGDFAKPAAVRAARRRIQDALAELEPGVVFASLAHPAEILFAEEALAAGAELNVVLATADPATAEQALSPAGAVWARRFRACCRKAMRLVTVAEDATADETGLADYAARVAMGLALLRAQHLDGEAAQVVLHAGSAETSAAARVWRESGRRQVTLSLKEGGGGPSAQLEERRCCALVFGDLPGFSKMEEKYLPIFWDQVMGAIGDVIGESKDAVALKNTWGDAIHLVVPDVRRAAEICLAVQRRLQSIDGRILGRGDAPSMRIGAHFGPVFEGWDPIAAHRTYYGRALSRAARIEPITPPGTVYVTEAFAAILLLESRGEFTCTYVGEVPLAKGFGTFRMYDLSAVAGNTA